MISEKRPAGGARLSWCGEAGEGLVWPRPLAPGAVVGVFAPAHQFEADELRRGAAVLRSWGLTVKVPAGLARRRRYLAGEDAHRLAILTALMEDDQVEGLVAVRGGFGCQRLLPALAGRWPAWPAKPIYGFSDLTALHLARLQAAGVIGFHGPMVVSLGKAAPGLSIDLTSQADFKKNLLSRGPTAGVWAFPARAVLKKGRARGPLLGGNLTLVTALLASPWRPDFTGAILLLEEVDEPPYRLDRLLTTLKQSPVWRQAAGLVFGGFTRCGPPPEVARLLKEAAEDFAGPVVSGAPFSHGRRNLSFPVGGLAELTAG